MESVLDALPRQQLDRGTVSLLAERTNLARVVAQYLAEAFVHERPTENLLHNIPEIAATETKLKEIVEKLGKFAGTPIRRFVSPRQLPLFELQEDIKRSDPVPVPENLTKVRIGSSTYGPLIFFALVILTKEGRRFASGTEITRVINRYLDDYDKKWPNNVSRALRSETLKSQKWLMSKPGQRRRQKWFGLADNWGQYWMDVFGEPAPDIG
jgi:hypothetical protein